MAPSLNGIQYSGIMISIGLDIGTAFVKCVSDTKKIKFPSLYAYKLVHEWDKKGKLVEGVGEEAVKLSQDPDTILIKPVMLGRPVHEEAFAKLVRHAVVLSSEKRDAIGSKPDDMAFAIGLPYDAAAHRGTIQKMIARLYRPKACDVVPQVLGTLVDAEKSSGIVMSIGQGTTEIVAFVNNKAIRGISVHHAVGYISSRLGSEMAYLDDTIYSSPKTGQLVAMLADSLLNKLHMIRQDLEKLPVIVSGGGILVPGMQEAVMAKLGDMTVPQDPVMSNAQGLYKIASWYSIQEKC
ncbi:MAG TPA: hypothetical protein VEU72_07605 [Nitrosopumilaceae archaeon]|nr:hypothetical protein [Nitrosopumilaceae archaeon]